MQKLTATKAQENVFFPEIKEQGEQANISYGSWTPENYTHRASEASTVLLQSESRNDKIRDLNIVSFTKLPQLRYGVCLKKRQLI